VDRTDSRADLIGLIYEAALDRTLWPLVINRLTDLVGAQVGQISTFDLRTCTGANIAPRMPPEAISEYDSHWVHQNPLIGRAKHVPTGRIFTTHDIIRRESFARTAIYNEFFAPHGIHESIGAPLLMDEATWAALGLWRNAEDGAFTTTDGDLLASIVPHLQRALQLSQRLASLELAREASAELLDRLHQAALLVDASCHVMFANHAAEALLADRAGLHRGADGTLRGDRYSGARDLHRLVAGAARRTPNDEVGAGGVVRFSRGEMRRPLTVLVLPLRSETDWLVPRRPVAMLFVSDPEREGGPTSGLLQQDYGLTRMEAAVALQLLDGRGLTGAAAQLGIAPTTARTHLTAVFGKTGTRRQVDLVRLLLQCGAVIREPSELRGR
jgi:DNA-binding CsgD family transcriptional regulator/GAF domain-containing protein